MKQINDCFHVRVFMWDSKARLCGPFWPVGIDLASGGTLCSFLCFSEPVSLVFSLVNRKCKWINNVRWCIFVNQYKIQCKYNLRECGLAQFKLIWLWRSCNLTASIHSSTGPVLHPFASHQEGPGFNPQGGTYVKHYQPIDFWIIGLKIGI